MVVIQEQCLLNFMNGYKDAWENADPAAAGALFTRDVFYRTGPFDAPMVTRSEVEEYWRTVTLHQQSIYFSYSVLSDRPGAYLTNWNVRYTRVPPGSKMELDGVFLLEFNGAGLCSRLVEWVHKREDTSH